MLTLDAANTIAGKAGTATAVTYTIHGDVVGTTDSFKVLAQGQLGTGAATIYTVPALSQALVRQIQLANATGSQVTGITFYVNGTAAGNQITGTISIPANGSAVYANGTWVIYDASGQTMFAGAVPSTRTINTTAPLTGGGDLSADRTLAISAATTSAAGSMSANDKAKLDNLWYDVTNYGFVGNGSTDNLAAWNTLFTLLPVNAVVYFPPGTYNVSGELAISSNKQLRITGAGEVQSLIQSTSLTANIFNINGAYWYNTFENLGFRSSVTKTAGAAITTTGGSAVGMDVRECSFSGMFYGIYCQGSLGGNISVFENLKMDSPAANGSQIKIDGQSINLVIVNSTINCGSGGGAVAGTKCIEINQCGAVQVLGCDIIGGINALHINATATVAAVYVANTFFDQSGGSTVKVSGGFSSSRIKFTQCGIASGVVGQHAVEIAGTGAGAAGTTTALPAGVDFTNCDIYYGSGAGGATASGIMINGCQDFNFLQNRISGFTGAGGCGIQVTPSSPAGTTRGRIIGNIIGPNENFTVGNETGIKLNAGAAAIGDVSINDNILAGNTTPITDASTVGTTTQKSIATNIGTVNGTSANATPNSTALTTVETVFMVLPIPANSLKVGTTFRFILNYDSAATTVTTVRIRVGTSATVPATNTSLMAVANATTAVACYASGMSTMSVIGGSAAHIGNGLIANGAVIATSGNIAASGTFNSAVLNYVMVTLTNTTSTTTTVFGGVLEIVGP